MINRFESRGMARRDAELVVTKMAQYENFFVGLMVSEELGLQIPEGEDPALIVDAFVMFLSFALFGAIPVSFYLMGPLVIFADTILFIISVTISLVVLTVLGMIKSTFSSSSIIYSAFEALVMGLIASFLAFLLAALIADVIL
jgi:VIT1/CCC1 family predicted Fe2+/Mn2+ transporter